jgi:hypothetical protein
MSAVLDKSLVVLLTVIQLGDIMEAEMQRNLVHYAIPIQVEEEEPLISVSEEQT